jgi:hypothetical protein
MRKEQREDLQRLMERMDAGFTQSHTAFAAHTIDDVKAFAELNRRLEPVEEARKLYKRAAFAIFVALIPVLMDACAHATKYLKP